MKFIKLNKELSLSPLKESDFPVFINRINDYNVYRYTVNIPYPYTLQDAYEALKYFTKRSKDFGRETSWSIRMNSEVIGGFGFKTSEDLNETECGYWLAYEFWNQGIMTKVLNKMSDIAFTTYKFKRIFAYTFEENISSARVLEKCNFKLKDPCIKGYYNKDGKIYNGMLYEKVNPLN